MNIQQQQAALASLPTDQTAIPILQKIAQGQHPMFPPGTEWMGLAKMNEVKRSMEAAQAMQQSAMAAPQGTTTVRDQVQQGVAALAQQQAQQQQMQQAILSGRQAPGVPAMAAGGAVARYAAGDKVEPPAKEEPSELRLLVPAALAGSAAAMSQLNALAPGLGYTSGGELLRAMAGTAVKSTKVPGLPASLAGKAGILGLLGGTAAQTAMTDTEDYRKRFGMETDDPSLGGDLLARSLGAASDLANMASFGYAEKYFRDKQGAPEPSAAAGKATPKPLQWTGGRLSPEYVNAVMKNGDPEAKQAIALYLQKYPEGANLPNSAPSQVGSGPASTQNASAPTVRTAPGGIATLAPKAELPTFVPELPEDPVAARKALVANEPLLQGDAFADRRKYADILAQREQAAAARNAADAPELERAAWTRKLLAAANAAGSQGGLKGIAAALGGFGAQSVKESDANRARREQQITLQQQAEDLRVKYQQETVAAERAVAEGRVAEALKHRENIRAIKEAAKKLRYEALLKVYEKDRDSEENALDRQNRLDVQGMANEGYASRSSSSGKTPAELYNMAVDNAQKELGDLAKTPQGMLMKPAELDRLRAERIAYHMRQLGLTPPAGVESASPSKPGGLSPADQALIDKYSTK